MCYTRIIISRIKMYPSFCPRYHKTTGNQKLTVFNNFYRDRNLSGLRTK